MTTLTPLVKQILSVCHTEDEFVKTLDIVISEITKLTKVMKDEVDKKFDELFKEI